MIRPSSLTLAEHCELAPVLASEYPETNSNIERGNTVDREVCRELLGGDLATDPDAMACLAWLANEGINATAPLGFLAVQEQVSLCDPQTGELITRGTPDIVFIWDSALRKAAPEDAPVPENRVYVIDLKKREQYFAGRLTDVDRSLQLHAYAQAWAIRAGASSYKLAYLMFGDGEASFLWSRVFEMAESRNFLDRMRRIVEKSNANASRGTRPAPTMGPHCTQCYQRLHCPSWLLPAYQGESGALSVLTSQGGLTVDNAGTALMAVMAMEEMAEKAKEILKAFATENGPIVMGDRQWGPVTMPAKRSGPTLKELEALNLMHLIKPGKPFQSWRIGKRQER